MATDVGIPAARAFAVHEALLAFLTREFPQEDPLVIITACSYEIGRIVGVVGDAMSIDDREHLLRGVMAVMRGHINSGLRR